MSELSATTPTTETNRRLKMNHTRLNDLINRGVAIRKQRIAEENAKIAALLDKLARERAENESAIRALLPQPLDEISQIDVGVRHAYINIAEPFPGVGKVRVLAAKNNGQWKLLEYEAYNPDGYYLRLPSLEEAVAYAAGALEI
jgi:hypothetical protein